MSTKHLNRNARDRRIAGSLAGLGKSRLETLEHHFLSQTKIIGKGAITPRARVYPTEQEKLSVQAVQGVIFFTGHGFQSLPHRVRSCSSVSDFHDLVARSSYE